ncbi:MAG: hypothetical protein OEN20_02665 [Gammaproteobacteria bacterium]|nr:hypothetical protein [Gammaproteobacteria bacterium]
MKHLYVTVVVALAAAMPAIAGQEEYDNCILQHLKGAKLDVAAHLIKQVCIDNYKTTGLSSHNRRAYNDCLLEHLVGVESVQATMDIKAACSSKYK